MFEGDPFQFTNGPRDAKVIVVGEAWGEQEEIQKKPFVGPSGHELDRMLFAAGLHRNEVLCTNVVDAHPPNNDFGAFAGIKKSSDTYNGVSMSPTLWRGLYKLHKLISTVNPTLVIGAGNIPLWALSSHYSVRNNGAKKLPAGIMSWRGSQLYTLQNYSTGLPVVPFLPIIHPAAILRSWDLRTITVHDLKFRAARFLKGETTWQENANYALLLYTPCRIVLSILERWLLELRNRPLELSIDIETIHSKHIVCIGLCDHETALCIPFFYFDEWGQVVDCYSLDEETTILTTLRKIMLHPNVCIIGQNFIYDAQFMRGAWGIDPDCYHDTMIAHHTMWPGTPKDLATLSSLYCEHHKYWKDESQEWSSTMGHKELWLYNCKDVIKTYEIAQKQKIALEREKMSEQFDFQMKQWRLTKKMSARGIAFNNEIRVQLQAEFNKLRNQYSSDLNYMLPQESEAGVPWYKSPAQTKDIFYRQLGFLPILDKKTKQPTTGAEALAQLTKKHRVFKRLFKTLDTFRSIEVFKSHFLDVPLSADGRLHAQFNVGGTETFRWSSSANPFGEATNLQNIPKGGEL